MQTYQFHINGMHCKACVILTEDKLKTLPGVSSIDVSLSTNQIQLTGNFEAISQTELLNKINTLLEPSGYSVSIDKIIQKDKTEYIYALLFAFAFFLIFIVLQKLGLVNIIQINHINPASAFVIGIIASLSTCMAVVGGLVLSLSANLAKTEQPLKPQILFHITRLITFFLLGGSIGALGAIFHLGITGNFIVNFILALILVILGLNLINLFNWPKHLQITLPKSFAQPLYKLQNFNHNAMPILAGALTFFLPCGFTQSMQIYAISTGQFLAGAKIMLFFALGTLPVLSLLSYGVNFFRNQKAKNIFIKTAGLIVLIFGIINLLSSLAVIGIIKPIQIF